MRILNRLARPIDFVKRARQRKNNIRHQGEKELARRRRQFLLPDGSVSQTQGSTPRVNPTYPDIEL